MWLLGREGADDQMSGIFYIAVVHEVLLYGLDMWVMYPYIVKTLGGFHHSMASILTVFQPQRGLHDTWVYPPPPMAEETMEACLQGVETYFTFYQNKVVQYIVTRHILYLCMAAEQHTGTRVSKQW